MYITTKQFSPSSNYCCYIIRCINGSTIVMIIYSKCSKMFRNFPNTLTPHTVTHSPIFTLGASNQKLWTVFFGMCRMYTVFVTKNKYTSNYTPNEKPFVWTYGNKNGVVRTGNEIRMKHRSLCKIQNTITIKKILDHNKIWSKTSDWKNVSKILNVVQQSYMCATCIHLCKYGNRKDLFMNVSYSHIFDRNKCNGIKCI